MTTYHKLKNIRHAYVYTMYIYMAYMCTYIQTDKTKHPRPDDTTTLTTLVRLTAQLKKSVKDLNKHLIKKTQFMV
jgi:uncharacterized protein YbcV (DUF1398 family)